MQHYGTLVAVTMERAISVALLAFPFIYFRPKGLQFESPIQTNEIDMGGLQLAIKLIKIPKAPC